MIWYLLFLKKWRWEQALKNNKKYIIIEIAQLRNKVKKQNHIIKIKIIHKFKEKEELINKKNNIIKFNK